MAEKLQVFSADPSTPSVKNGKTFPWAEYTDGSIWKVVEGVDYDSQRGFLAALTKRGKKSGMKVRFVRLDNAVEFEFEPIGA